MSIVLQYPAKCEMCRRVIPAGKEATYLPSGDGKFEYVHHPECPSQDEPRPAKGQNFAPRAVEWDLRECARCGTEYAIRPGTTPPSPFVCSNTAMCEAYANSKAAA